MRLRRSGRVLVALALLASDVIVDYRPGAGIRVAPHFYTSDEEIEAAVELIDDILAHERWRRYADTVHVVS